MFAGARTPWRCGVVAWALAAALFAGVAASPGTVRAADSAPVEGGTPEDVLFGASEDQLFGASDDELFSFDEDSLFGGDLLTDVEDAAEGSPEEAFLVRDRVDVGGTYRAASGWNRVLNADGEELHSGFSLTGRVTLYADARPRPDFRAFAKLKGEAALRDGGDGADVRVGLHELFVDFDVARRFYFRAGKQTVTWGVGYFFSPADVVNIGRLDPEDPEAEREGPVAVRMHVPSGRNNWYGYVLLDGNATDGFRVALAPKAEFVVGRSEVGVGLYYSGDRVPRAMATLSTSAGPVAVFAELVASRGSDKRFVRETASTPLNPLGLETYVDGETLFVHATAGARYTYSDPDGRFSVTGAVQYYFNGEGYSRDFLRDHGWKLFALRDDSDPARRLSDADVLRPGRHYGALLVSGSHERWHDFGVRMLWLGGLSDGSGTVSLSVDYGGWKHLRPSVSFSRTYGNPGGEFAPLGNTSLWMLSVGVGASF